MDMAKKTQTVLWSYSSNNVWLGWASFGQCLGLPSLNYGACSLICLFFQKVFRVTPRGLLRLMQSQIFLLFCYCIPLLRWDLRKPRECCGGTCWVALSQARGAGHGPAMRMGHSPWREECGWEYTRCRTRIKYPTDHENVLRGFRRRFRLAGGGLTLG